MGKLDLSAEVVRARFNYDPLTGSLTRKQVTHGYFVGSEVGTTRTDGYRSAQVFGNRYMVHWLIWLHVHGRWPTEELDHINGARSDNRLANLREVTRMQNAQNIHGPKPDNRSGHMGVYRHRNGKFQAQIRANNRKRFLGTFKTAEEASAAYQQAKRSLHT